MANRAPFDEDEPGVLSRAVGLVTANPAGSGGVVLVGMMATAIVVNALYMQPGRHPAPLFAGMQQQPAPAANPLANLVDGADAVTAPSPDVLVADIQRGLQIAGFYSGSVDGLMGPKTAAAISAFQEVAGLEVTGEPSPSILTALRSPPPKPQSALPEDPLGDAIGQLAVNVPLPRAKPVMEDPISTATIPKAPPVSDAVRPVQVEPVRVDPDQQIEAPPPPVSDAPTVPQAAAGDPRLARVQKALDLLGYGPLKPDGVMSEKTRLSIRRFEENRGLPVTGRINEAFLAELIKIGGLDAQ